MFSKKFQRKYALTDQGLKNTKKGVFWTVIVNLVVMVGIGVLYLMMSGFIGTLTDENPLPGVWLPDVYKRQAVSQGLHRLVIHDYSSSFFLPAP